MTAIARDRAWLAERLPHRGRMNLLEAVARWDSGEIDCIALSHREPTNPLRLAGRLPVAAGIEYAAQAVAAHGALTAEAEGPLGRGYLASVRSVSFHVERLDDIEGPLAIHAERIGSDARGVLYAFQIEGAGRRLIDGRVAVVLDAARRPLAGAAP